MPKHKVEIIASFERTSELGALMVEGREVAPPKTITTKYAQGQLVTFDTKRDAEAFVKRNPDYAAYSGALPPKGKTKRK